jgi:hypothetical protein
MTSVYLTTVVNICGGEKHFSFLPPHGVTMSAKSGITYTGEIWKRLIPSWPYNVNKNRQPNPRKVTAIKQAVMSNQILLFESKKPILDPNMTKLVKLHKCLGYEC